MDDRVLSKRDTHQAITEKIVAAIEKGAGEFRMPWHRGASSIARPVNAATGKPYQGTNVIALWADASLRGFSSGHWATYRQWRGLGAQVRKGPRGAPIVFFRIAEEHEEGEQENEQASAPRLLARTSWVFNAEQVEGWTPPTPVPRDDVEVRSHVDAFIDATKAEIWYGGDEAYYHTADDYIAMPYPEQFAGTETSSATECFYAVHLHEIIHWTGASHRLARTLQVRFGDEAYAMEELIAELGAAFLCADLQVANEPRPDHARYVASWLKVLNGDSTAIFTAANKANAAIGYLAMLTGGLTISSAA
jgi:antirestriction protein ArdC